MFETYIAVSEASTPLAAAKCSFVYLKDYILSSYNPLVVT